MFLVRLFSEDWFLGQKKEWFFNVFNIEERERERVREIFWLATATAVGMRKTNFEAYTSLLYYSAFHFSLSLSPSLSFIFGQENARKKRKTEWNSTTCNFAITNKLQITFCPKDIELIISFKFSKISQVTITIQKIFNIHRYLSQDLMANIRINHRPWWPSGLRGYLKFK